MRGCAVAAAAVTPPELILLNVAALGGTVMVLAIAGSSRRCRYSSPVLGRGTASVGFVYPSGTDTLCVNCGSDEIESIRNSDVPFSVHCAFGSFAGGVLASLTGGGGPLASVAAGASPALAARVAAAAVADSLYARFAESPD